jgi:hypothetical protein
MDAFSHGFNGHGNGLGGHDIPFCFLDSFMYMFSKSNIIIPIRGHCRQTHSVKVVRLTCLSGHHAITSYKQKPGHHGVYITTKFLVCFILSSCSLQTCPVLFLHEVPWSTRYPRLPLPRFSFIIIVDFAFLNPRPYPYSLSFLSSYSRSALHAPHSQPRNLILELQRKPHGDAQEKQALFQIPKDVNRRIYELLWRATEELGPCIVGEDKFAAANLTGLINEGAKLGGTVLVGEEDREGVDRGGKPEVTYYPGIDSQFDKLLTLFTRNLCAVGEDGDTAAFIAHEHIAFEWRDDVELSDDDAEIPGNSFLAAFVRQRASDIIHICKCVQCSHNCILKPIDYIIGDEKWRIDMFFLRQSLYQRSQASSLTHIRVDVNT